MSECSKKCNEIKQKIDSISGLDDDFVYDNLLMIEQTVNTIVKIINDYADEDETNGTCFNRKERMSNKTEIEKDIKIVNTIIENSNNIMSDLREREVQAIENILADRKRLEKENENNKEALEILNKMKREYKIALFMMIRNSTVMPKRN